MLVGGTMALPLQGVSPGALEVAYHRELKKLLDRDVLGRLWRKDTSLWPHDESQETVLRKNLGWLDLPERIAPYMARVVERTTAIESAGFQDLIFVGIGGSNLAAETIAGLPVSRRGNHFLVLDTTDPASIRRAEEAVDFPRTLFVFAAKSGKNIETHALLLYFLDKLKRTGVEDPGSHFIAVTEENSYLAVVAKQYHFRDIFFDPPGISGRYSSVIHFGLLFSTICGIDPSAIFSSVSLMRDACGPAAKGESNPALALGALLAAGARDGWDRLAFLPTKSVVPLTFRIAQLVGGSTGKGGEGIIPIFGELPITTDAYLHGCIVAGLALEGDDPTETQQAIGKLRQANVPVVQIDVASAIDIAAELFKWEVATALACALLEVEPFLEPNIRESRDRTAEILEDITSKQDFSVSTVRVEEEGISLYAEGSTRQEISTLNLTEALRTFFELRSPDGYVALLTFMHRNEALEKTIRALGEQIAVHLGLPVLPS